MLAVTVIVATASGTAMADQQHGNRNSGFNSSFNPGFNSGFNSNTVSRHIQNKRYNTYVASRFRARQYSPVNAHTRVIYNQPTVVYVNNNSGNPGHVITQSSERRNESSPLRNINGLCFERSYDSRGLETRVQLPDSACNF